MFSYLIGWSSIDRYYYGCRYSKTAHPSQLWTTYFTSSRVVASMRKQYGEPDVVEVRKIFTNKHSCLVWEHKVLRRLNAANSVRWLNVTNGSLFANSKHKVVVKDAVTGVMVGAVDEDHPLYLSGEYIFHLKGVSTNRPSPMKGKERHQFKGTTLYVNPHTGECFKLPKTDARILTDGLMPWLSIYCHAVDRNTGQVVSVKRSDPRLITGELSYVTKGMVPVKDPTNPATRLSVHKDDPRLATGELVHVRCGMKSNDPSKASRPKEKNGRWNGITDAAYIQMLFEAIDSSNNTLRWAQLAEKVGLPKSRYHLRQVVEEKIKLPTYR